MPTRRYRGIWFLAIFILACLTTFVTILAEPVLQAQGLFANASEPDAANAPERSVLRRRWVTVQFERLRETLPAAAGGEPRSRELSLNLFDDAQFVAVLDRIEATSTGYVWVGRLRGVDGSGVKLAVNGNAIAGSVTTATAAYAIRPVQNALHVIQQIDVTALPPEAPPLVPDLRAADAAPPVAMDDGSLIDVLVLYTPSARDAQGGVGAIEALIDLGISETNQAYANSGVIHRLRLVRKELISYTESGSMSTDLGRLQNTSDGFLDTAHTIRDTYKADLVQLIENSPDACGIAYLMTTVSTSFAPFAVGITHYPCISPNYSFAHEMGHNMGLRHDTYVDTGTTPYTYSHGYVNQAAFVGGAPSSSRWRDIMAYNDQCVDSGFNCARLQYFSNPSVSYLGSPMGHATTADAVTSLNNVRTTVSSFRLSALPSLSISDSSLSEGNSGTTNASFTVTLSAAHDVPVTVNYATADGTAISAGNTGTISIPGTADPGTPYPSSISIPSGFGSITNVKVKIRQFSHTYPADADILLVGPLGQNVVLMSDVGGFLVASNVDLTFDDASPGLGGGQLVSGSYAPTNIEDFEGGDTYASPAPVGPYGTALSVFNGTDPTGTWKLFVVDDFTGDGGTIAGWSLELTPSGRDFTPVTGILTFAPGVVSQPINVPVIGDSAVESNETFSVNLSSPVNATIVDGVGAGTITNDDALPVITSHPSSSTIASGQTATLSVVATGSGLSYQWYLGPSGTTTSPIPGATSNSYTTPALTTTTTYWVMVSNASGPANSSSATVTVNNARRRSQVTSI